MSIIVHNLGLGHNASFPLDEELGEDAARVEALACLGKMIAPGQVIQILALNASTSDYGRPHTEAGFFDDPEEAADRAIGLSSSADAVYYTPNCLDPSLMARIGNRVRPVKAGEAATDKDVTRRRWLMVDVDPRRPPGIPATDAERDGAMRVAREVRTHLDGLGWSGPVAISTGNGACLLYRVDLEADDDGLTRRCLLAIRGRFATADVEIDTAVANAARGVRLPGTYNRKGDGSPDRPHRQVRVIYKPEAVEIVPSHLLIALASEVGDTTTKAIAPAARGDEAARHATRYLDSLPDSVAGEHGHDRLFRAACVLMIDFDLGKDRARPILADWNDRKARPPWDGAELEHKLDEATKRRNEADPSRIGRLLRSALAGEEDAAVDPYAGSAGDQPEPRPIRDELLPVPPMPAAIIPAPFRAWLADIATRIGCPLDFVAVAAMVLVATVVGRKVAIRPKRHDDWTVVPNLWGGVVGRPGELKTPALEEVMRVLRRLAQEAGEAFEREQAGHEAAIVLAKIEADAARDAYKSALKAKVPTPPEELAKLAARVMPAALEPPVWRRLIVGDATIEKLLELLRDNPNGLLIFRDELTGWLRSMEKQGREADRAFYLEAWNGTGSFTSDRIARGTVHAEAVCLSLLGGIQPDPLCRLLRATARGEAQQDDGLVSRLQLLVYPDPVGAWTNVDRFPDAEAKARAFAIVERLDRLDAAAVGAEADPVRGGPAFLRFAPEAQDLFDTWRAGLENEKLRAEHESPLIESHLAKYRSLMPSLALLFHLVEVAGGEASGPVSLRSAGMAAAWCDYLEAHARRIYQCGLDGDAEPARRLAARIRKGSVETPFSARVVVQHGWSGLDTTEDVDRAVATLARHDWVRAVEVPTRGRPKTLIFINPRVAIGGRP